MNAIANMLMLGLFGLSADWLVDVARPDFTPFEHDVSLLLMLIIGSIILGWDNRKEGS